MYKTMTVLVCAFFVLLSLSAMTDSAMADNLLWTNDTGDGLWDTQDNWWPQCIPEIWYNDKVQINYTEPNAPNINAGMAAECQWLALSDGGEGDLFMTGGTLEVNTPPAGGDSWFIIAYGEYDVGTFMLDGGTVITGNRVFVGFKGTGIIDMTGGNFNIGGMFGIGFCDAGFTTGQGYVYLAGGTIRAANFLMSYPPEVISLLDISGGTLIIDGDKKALIESYIADDRIIAYNGQGGVSVDYNNINLGKTTVKSSMDLTKAYNPSPANNAENVLPDANLSWTAGIGATSHYVYFGTTNPPASIDTQPETTYDPPGMLDFETTYYWRINEVNESNTVIGNVWKFTTVSERATNPDPNDGAGDVAGGKILSWTPGYDANTHDVYLGTDESGVRLTGDLDLNGIVDWKDLARLTDYWLADPAGTEPYAGVNGDDIVDFFDYALLAANWMMDSNSFFKGNQDANSFDPNGLEPETTYYWRIDEINGSGKKTKGNTWSFNTHYSLIGKVMCGYQGWFACPGDGSGRGGWVHWSTSSTLFDYTHLKIDMWPDTNEYAVKYQATGFNLGSPPYYVFSSYDSNTTMVHFRWMQEYGIDGVFVQRFGSDFGAINFLNTVLTNCKTAANTYGRKYAVMYDLTGYTTSSLVDNITADWIDLENNLGIADSLDEAYIKHNGKPVIAIYGIFGTGVTNYPDPALCATLIEWFKDRGFTVMIGVNNDWRTRSDPNDPDYDANFQLCVSKADIIMPWDVGRYDSGNVGSFCTNNWIPDLNWCNTNNKDYSVCIFPGFSWNNWNGGGFNQIPRNGGQFIWDQLYLAKSNGANMIYVAMFDEVDEGTAIFKVSNDPPPPSGGVEFVTLDVDGYPLPSDEYLWLVGQACRALRGEIPLDPNRPPRP